MDFRQKTIMDSNAFVLLADFVPGIIQEIRYYGIAVPVEEVDRIIDQKFCQMSAGKGFFRDYNE